MSEYIVLYRIVSWSPGKQSEVDDGENEVKAEELSVVPLQRKVQVCVRWFGGQKATSPKRFETNVT